MIDKPETGQSKDEATKEQLCPSGNATGALGGPAYTGQPKANKTNKASQYAKYIVRLLIASYGGIQNFFGFLDKHNGTVGAFAAVVIAVLTGFYVYYSHAQWKVMSGQLTEMQNANKLTRQYISASNEALFFFQPEHFGYTPQIVRLTFRNQGKVAAKDVSGEVSIGSLITSSGIFQVSKHFRFGGPGTIVDAIFPHYEWTDMDLPSFSSIAKPPYEWLTLPTIKADGFFDNGFGEKMTQRFCNYYWNGNWIECSGIDALINSKRKRR